MKKGFEILEHPADVGFLAYGETLAELFESAALAMCSLACAPGRIEERLERVVDVEATDVESLLYAWLAEILFIIDAEQIVCRRVDIGKFLEPKNGNAGQALGIARGEKFDRSRHDAGTYIKAVTLHQFKIERTEDGYRARVFLDL